MNRTRRSRESRPQSRGGGTSKRWFAQHLVVLGIAAVAAISMVPANAQEVLGDASIGGAGSSFVYPALSRWSHEYQRTRARDRYSIGGGGLDSAPAGAALEYEPVGSLAGLLRLKAGAIDFAVSDAPLSSQELTKLGMGQFPIVVGGIVAVVNIDGVRSGELKLTGPVLAGIFLGRIGVWSDPAIKELNPTLKLPDAKIVVLHRADGSGTTFNFTDYLARVSPQWKEAVGSDLLVAWPTGSGAKGNEGLARTIKRTKNAIGYVEFAQATQARLDFAMLQNKAGNFVTPGAASFQAAAAGADWAGTGDFSLLLTDAADPGAYPIAATAFVLMSRTVSPAKTRRVIDFFQWSLEKGAKEAAQLGYVPLPEPLVEQVKSYWLKTFKAGT